MTDWNAKDTDIQDQDILALANLTDNSPLRWHCNSDPRLRLSGDTVAKHSQRVQMMCHSLAAHLGHDLTRSDLLFAALHHDAAEAVVGDMPGPAKERFHDLADEYASAERRVLIEMGLTWKLTRLESDMLHLADKLDAYLWARHCKAADTDEWRRAESKLWARAKALGAQAWLQERLDRGVE
jgi:5'-deoxynucleotidase YfbR-like HD superfamily hydrolase